MDEPLVAAAEFHTAFEAEIAVGLLQSNGIPATLAGRYDNKTYPKVIFVAAKNLTTTQKLLAETCKSDGAADPDQQVTPVAANRTKRRRQALAIVLLAGALWGIGEFLWNSSH